MTETSASMDLAPCVVIVGPANSGKTTFLDVLDRALQEHAAQPLVVVVKGSPDGTGHYMHGSPELRNHLKPYVKGRWIGAVTVAAIRGWIDQARRHLDLVLVDLGGRHAPENTLIYAACTHYLVLARTLPTSEEEDASGLESWARACEQDSLRLLARIRSRLGEGDVEVNERAGVVEGVFRADPGSEYENANRPLIDAVVRALLSLPRPQRRVDYFDLRLGRRWKREDVPSLAGLGGALDDRVRSSGAPVVLGGAAPLWAYVTALHRVLDLNPEAIVRQFDPKVAGALVGIPAALAPAEAGLGREERVEWGRHDRGWAVLHLLERRPDRILDPESFAWLPHAPLPEGEPPPGPLVVSGKSPLWLHLTYSRWLRATFPGRAIGVYDANEGGGAFLLTGPGTPRFEAGDPPVPPGAVQLP